MFIYILFGIVLYYYFSAAYNTTLCVWELNKRNIEVPTYKNLKILIILYFVLLILTISMIVKILNGKFSIYLVIFNMIMCFLLSLQSLSYRKKLNMKERLVTLLSVDRIYALSLKETEEIGAYVGNLNRNEKKDLHKNFIISRYIFNVIFLLIILMTLICLYYIKADSAIKIILSLMIARLLSRSIEISIAFYKDVIIDKGEKSSSFNNVNRLTMSILSLIEIVISCTIIYTMFDIIYPDITTINYNLDIIYLLTNNLFKSTINSITFCSGAITQSRLFNFVIVLQAITSFVLIVFTFASYMSENKDTQ